MARGLRISLALTLLVASGTALQLAPEEGEEEINVCENKKLVPYESSAPDHKNTCLVYCVPKGECEAKLGSQGVVGMPIRDGECRKWGFTTRLALGNLTAKVREDLDTGTGPCRGIQVKKFKAEVSPPGCRAGSVPLRARMILGGQPQCGEFCVPKVTCPGLAPRWRVSSRGIWPSTEGPCSDERYTEPVEWFAEVKGPETCKGVTIRFFKRPAHWKEQEPAAPNRGKPVAPIREEPATPVWEEPATPVRDPAWPVREPLMPVREPLTPIRAPAWPVREPAWPVVEPASPIRKPAMPIRKPATPVFEPLTPIKEPATPFTEDPVAPITEEPWAPVTEEPMAPITEGPDIRVTPQGRNCRPGTVPYRAIWGANTGRATCSAYCVPAGLCAFMVKRGELMQLGYASEGWAAVEEGRCGKLAYPRSAPVPSATEDFLKIGIRGKACSGMTVHTFTDAAADLASTTAGETAAKAPGGWMDALR